MTDTSRQGMIHAIEADLRAAWSTYGLGPGCELLDSDRITRVLTGMPHAIYNAVVYLRASADEADALMQETVSYFREKRVPSTWWLGPETAPSDFDLRLRAFSPTAVSHLPGMAMDLSLLGPVPALAPEVVIREVTDDATLRQYVEVDFEAFGFSPSWVDRMVEIDSASGYGPGRPWRHFMALRNGEPLGNTSLFTGAGVAGLYGVATLPSARGQGIATGLVLHVLHEAKDTGYRIATLQASEQGFPVYRRIGFEEYCKLHMYEWDVSEKR